MSELLYHVTFTKYISKILSEGIRPMQTSNWVRRGDGERYGDGEIYACDNPNDAIRWAFRMEWEHDDKTVIISFVRGTEEWTRDTGDPLSQESNKGHWLKCVGRVPPENFRKVTPMSLELSRMLTEGKDVKLGNKEAMITSDSELANNTHPANNDGVAGAPVLDGELVTPERANVNAMREALETQKEMEVGKPVEEKQEEVKAEEKEVTVGKGQGTQIIINIAGKKKQMTFSNLATAHAFIKGASAKFGDKFSVLSRPDQCPKCGSINNYTAFKDGKRYNPFERGQGLWDTNKCKECGNVWPFRIVHMVEDKPATSGMSDIDGGAPNLKSGASSTREYVIRVGDNKYVAKLDTGLHLTPSLNAAHRYDSFDNGREATADASEVKNTIAKGQMVKIVPTSTLPFVVEGSMKTATEYNVEKRGGKWGHWYVIGLPQEYDESPDSLIIPGLNYSMDTPESVAHGIYESLYDLFQTNDNLKDGDIFNTPAGKYICQHIHVLPYDDKAKSFFKKKEQSDDIGVTGALKTNKKEKKASGMNFSPSNVPSQVVQEFYPELQHELIAYPNATNAPMVNPEISGDQHTLGVAPAEGIGEAVLQLGDEELLPGAIEDAFDGMARIGYVSTSPAGGAMGRDGKPQVLEGAPLRKENDIRGPMFTDEFYANYQQVPGAALAISASTDELKELQRKRRVLVDRMGIEPRGGSAKKDELNSKLTEVEKKIKELRKKAGAEDKDQFALFLKRVMGEVAASFIAAFKVTTRMPMNQIPGVGEIQLAQIEQATNVSSFNIVNTGSRVRYLLDKLTDSEVQDAINEGYAQGAIWHEGKEGGFVYEVFVRAETIDTESMILKYRFVTGTKE